MGKHRFAGCLRAAVTTGAAVTTTGAAVTTTTGATGAAAIAYGHLGFARRTASA